MNILMLKTNYVKVQISVESPLQKKEFVLVYLQQNHSLEFFSSHCEEHFLSLPHFSQVDLQHLDI
jgi:hypothetical protein